MCCEVQLFLERHKRVMQALDSNNLFQEIKTEIPDG
jgi:hypothetical protein